MKRPLRFSMSLSILFLSPMSAIVSVAVDIPLSLSSEKNYIVEVVLPGGSTSANIEDGRITAEGASQALATVVYYDVPNRLPEWVSRQRAPTCCPQSVTTRLGENIVKGFPHPYRGTTAVM